MKGKSKVSFLPSFVVLIGVLVVAGNGLLTIAADPVNVNLSADNIRVEVSDNGYKVWYTAGFQQESSDGTCEFSVILDLYHDGQFVQRLSEKSYTGAGTGQSECREFCALAPCTGECSALINGWPSTGRCQQWQFCTGTLEKTCRCKVQIPDALDLVTWGPGDELRMSVSPGNGANEIDPSDNELTLSYQ